MVDKYNLSVEKNIFLAKRNIAYYIWKSANLEGIAVTYPGETNTLIAALGTGAENDERILKRALVKEIQK